MTEITTTTELTGPTPVHASLALESMRNSDFDTKSALGELIDNSIEAKADTVRIRFFQKDLAAGKRGPSKIRTTKIACGDNGHGMTLERLLHCLQLGYSDRDTGKYGKRKGIGRFGVGMTLGAINQCRRIEVYTRSENKTWMHTYLDLDDIRKQGESATLPTPEEKTPPDDVADLCVGETGSIVVWTKCDRMQEHNLGNIAHWIGRTYRKHIASQILQDQADEPAELVNNPNPVSIELLGPEGNVPIRVYDPLYQIPCQDGDSPSQLWPTVSFDVEVDEDILEDGEYGALGTVKVRLALLPPELRTKRLSGTAEGKARFIDEDHLGISILREGREVYYGRSVGFLKKIDGPGNDNWEELGDRYWGAELDFPATLDTSFAVRNIKTGARPLPELAEKIRTEITQVVLAMRKQIRDQWDQDDANRRDGKGASEDHSKAEQITTHVPSSPVPKAPSEADQKKVEERIEELLGPEIKAKGKTLEELRKTWGSFKIVSDLSAHPSGPFVEVYPDSKRKQTVVSLTGRHEFVKFIDGLVADFEDFAHRVKDPIASELLDRARKLRASLDLLLVGFADSHNRLVSTDGPQNPEWFFKHLILNWGLYLDQAVKQLAAEHE